MISSTQYDRSLKQLPFLCFHLSEDFLFVPSSHSSYSLTMRSPSALLKRRLYLSTALSAATQSLELKPGWYEALYARARVLREKNHLSLALIDVIEAERNAPSNNLKEIRQLLQRIKEEIKKTTRCRFSCVVAES